ncbi:MAG: ParB N-terminal domain-containing protein [Spirochaetales bacterium]|nr:ParB N-terminal domain-containing protein [Spirochaetales bacterium]
MQIRTDEIKVKKRIRKDLGDLTQLMESIKTHGLLNPIVVNERKELIAGERRLESIRRLGWPAIEVHVIHAPSEVAKIQMEIDENLYRRALSTSELSDGFSKIDKIRNPGFIRKFIHFLVKIIKKIFKRS